MVHKIMLSRKTVEITASLSGVSGGLSRESPLDSLSAESETLLGVRGLAPDSSYFFVYSFI